MVTMMVKDAVKLLSIYEDQEEQIVIVWRRKGEDTVSEPQLIEKKEQSNKDWPTDY
jgi:hypothetical protein